MLELKVTLEFACCRCDHSVSVTVRCQGKGLADGDGAVAEVNVPCPACGIVNQLYFEPNGTVRAVASYRVPLWQVVPSAN
jgi:hypothetical protein